MDEIPQQVKVKLHQRDSVEAFYFMQIFHLLGADVQDGVTILAKSGVKGFIFPAETVWLMLIIEERSVSNICQLITGKQHLLLHYIARNGSREFSLYKGDKLVSHYSHHIHPHDVFVDNSNLHWSKLKEILINIRINDKIGPDYHPLKLVSAVKIEYLHELFTLTNDQLRLLETDPVSEFANIIGLNEMEGYDFNDLWAEYHYQRETFDLMYPGVCLVHQ